VAAQVMRRQHDLLITNVPGPQLPLYAAGAPLVASYPMLPLGPGHLLAVGVTSYNGEAFFGLTGDRDALSDLDVLAQCMADAVEELRDTTAVAGSFRQPTRKASAAAKRAAAKKAAAREEAARRAASQRRAAMRHVANRAVELGASAARASALREQLSDLPPPPARRPARRAAGSKAAKTTTTEPPGAEGSSSGR
jgi:diacylglycerol O-acyltransferase